jgi:hypothetical protein
MELEPTPMRQPSSKQPTPKRRPGAQHIALFCCVALILGAGLFCGASTRADNVPVPSKHQMMKDCMAKQKASEAGRSKEDMKNSCKDVTKTEKQNADKASAAPQSKE